MKKYCVVLVMLICLVGWLELIDYDSMDWCGIGWCIEDDLIVINWYVVSLFVEC